MAGPRKPPIVRDLGEHIKQQTAAWKVATPEERKVAKKAFTDAGWKSCRHADCPPWSCEKN